MSQKNLGEAGGTVEVPLSDDEFLHLLELQVVIAGGPGAFARLHGVKPAALLRWRLGLRRVPDVILARLGIRRETRFLLTVPE